MATEVKLPRLGQGMESGTIVRWLKAEGDSVKKREPLYELDTDKVTQEVESDLDGMLLKILVAEGEVEVGSTIAMIENGSDCRGSGARECAEPAPHGGAGRPQEARCRRAPPRRPRVEPEPRRSRSRAAASLAPATTAGGADQGVAARAPDRARARRRPGGARRHRARTGGSSPTTSRRPRSAARRSCRSGRRRRRPRARSRS